MKNTPLLSPLLPDLEKIAKIIAFNACMDLLLELKTKSGYSEISNAIGLFPGSSYLARLLGERMHKDHNMGNPLSSSLIVSKKTGIPGEGYFITARALGYTFPDNFQGKKYFWQSQIDQIMGNSSSTIEHEITPDGIVINHINLDMTKDEFDNLGLPGFTPWDEKSI